MPSWRKASLRFAKRAGLSAAFRAAGRDVRVLAYHAVDDPARFEAHLDHLQRHYNAVDLDTAIAALEQRRPLPPRSVLVTFDDGDRSVYTEGLPRLAARNMPAVLFVVAGFIGGDQPFWWEEVASAYGAEASATVRALKAVPDADRRVQLNELRTRAGFVAPTRRHLNADELVELDRRGVAIGSHSNTHPCLDQCDDDTIDAEVGDAHEALTQVLGHAPRAFAYPNGNVDDRVAAAVRAAGYPIAFVFDHRTTAWPPPDPLRVSRLRVNATDDLDEFALKVSGAHAFALHARRR
jgi:peptidoglycan/xylan/chitin deacetylase (PgdA/CDA1 family)